MSLNVTDCDYDYDDSGWDAHRGHRDLDSDGEDADGDDGYDDVVGGRRGGWWWWWVVVGVLYGVVVGAVWFLSCRCRCGGCGCV